MIKKELKTLSQLKNPPPDERWRIHLDDGSFIDVVGIEERNRTIGRLYVDGRISIDSGTVRVSRLNTATFINLNITINRTEDDNGGEVRTPEEPKKTLWNLFKEDFGNWSWREFKVKSIITLICSLISLVVWRSISPIKTTDGILPLEYEALVWFSASTFGVSFIWVIQKLWKILPYITCWFKLFFFLLIFILLSISVGLFNMGIVEDKIMCFIGKYGISNRELKILKTIIP